MRHALRKRYGHARSPEADVARWLANAREWWARAEKEAPVEVLEYRRAKRSGSEAARRAALVRLKEALR